MKTKILSIIAVLILALSCIFIVSCDDGENYTDIEILYDSVVKDGVIVITMPAKTESFDLSGLFTAEEKTKCKITSGLDIVSDTNIALNYGDNLYTVTITDKNDNVKAYNFNIYRKKMFNVTFVENGGTDVADVTIEEGEPVAAPDSKKAGYTLKWVGHNFDDPVSRDLEIVAEWTANKYKVTLSAPGSEADGAEIEVTYGEQIPALPDASKIGWSFLGWKADGASFDIAGVYNVANDTTLTADYQIIKYSITYSIESGAENSENNTALIEFTVEDKLFELLENAIWVGNSEYAQDEKSFAGWVTKDGIAIEADTILTSDVVLVPVFNVVPFSSEVTFIVDGEEYAKETYNYRDAFVLPVYETDAQHIFNGWKLDGEFVVSGTYWKYKTDISLVADIELRDTDIHYVMGEATNNPDNKTTINTEEENFTLLAPTYGNHIFDGWYLDIAFENKIEEITSDLAGQKITLYPKWIFVTNIVFVPDGGICETESEVYKDGYEYTLPTVTKDRYNFDGWYDGDVRIPDNGTWVYRADTELVAKWTPISYTITYVINGGTLETNKNSFTVESGVIVLDVPEKEFARFVGWTLEDGTAIDEINSSIYNYSITLYANWDVVNVKVTLNPAGGSVDTEKMDIILGSDYKISTPERPGFKFDGWVVKDTNNAISLEGQWTLNQETVELVALWSKETYTITYEDYGTTDGLKTSYDIETDSFSLPTPVKEGFIFVGWSLNGGAAFPSVTVTQGSTGNRTYTAVWCQFKDENTGIYFSFDSVNKVMTVVGIEREINTDLFYGVYIPSTYNGYTVTSIGKNAFTSFGIEVGQNLEIVNASDKTVTIYIPTTVTKIGAYAFEGCKDIRVNIYENGVNFPNYKDWDAKVTYEVGNRQARDCIWGFRPAIGWTRYTAAKIPDDYE